MYITVGFQCLISYQPYLVSFHNMFDYHLQLIQLDGSIKRNRMHNVNVIVRLSLADGCHFWFLFFCLKSLMLQTKVDSHFYVMSLEKKNISYIFCNLHHLYLFQYVKKVFKKKSPHFNVLLLLLRFCLFLDFNK